MLNTAKGILSDKDFSEMSEWDVSAVEAMGEWIQKLEEYDVFFSSPLDIDFLMLEHYIQAYKNTLNEKEGPRLMISDNGNKIQRFVKDIEELDPPYSEFVDRVSKDVHNSLKDCGGDGKTYSEKQQLLMVWYTYFFLNRGKPSTHIEALSQLNDKTLISSMPEVFKRIIEKSNKILTEKNDEDCYCRQVDTE